MGLPYIYRQASKCLKFSFYLNGEFILNIDDLLSDKSLKDEEPNFDTEDIGGYIISGNLEKTLESIEKYFENLQKIKLPVNITKTYLTELYITIIRQAPNKGLDSYVKNMIKFSTSNSIEEIKQEIVKTASDITKNNFIEISSKQSDIIKRALAYIDENLHDEHLSLKLICKDVVFISIDYFGKLFKKEVGENFPQYVMRKRIEASIDMIADSSVEKIYEIADKVGFGDNAQYFSQVFKKVLGITPTQYKEKYFTK